MANHYDHLLEAYLSETGLTLTQIDERLSAAERAGVLSAEDTDEIFRHMHTIKGASALMEFQSLTETAHHAEDILAQIRNSGTAKLRQTENKELFGRLFHCTERIRAEIAEIENPPQSMAEKTDESARISLTAIFERMERLVWTMKRTMRKNVRLTVIGAELEVERSIADGIADPLMHLLRNALAHGVEESEAERVRQHKDPQAEIILAVRYLRGDVIFSVTDDGRGIDAEWIAEKAQQKGLLKRSPETLHRAELLSLLMIPGFTTSHQVTEFSGRGVGLDVVRQNVEALRGKVSISSRKGGGTAITLSIPENIK